MTGAAESDPVDGLHLLVHQTRQVCAAGWYSAALMLALTLPDICGALGAENGRATGSKTKAWLDRWMPGPPGRSSALWGLRCSLLHQGAHFPDDGSPRVIFLARNPENVQVHGGTWIAGKEEAVFLDVSTFIEEVTDAVSRWLAEYGSTHIVRRNMIRFAHRREDGLSPFVSGFPVIA